MITTDRGIIKLNIHHPSSSLVISNPDNKLAIVFQIAIELNLIQDNQISKGLTYEINEFEISPVRGIILPKCSQLIKIYGKSQNQRTKINKKPKQSYFPYQKQVGSVIIKCSYLLEYNKQKIVILRQNQTDQQLIQLKKLQLIQSKSLNLYIYSDTYKEKSPIQSLVDKNCKQESLRESKFKSKGQIAQNVKLEPLDLNTVMSTYFIKNFQEQQLVNFQNSKLNQDYDLVRNRANFESIQRKRSNQLFKMFGTQSDQKKSLQMKTEKGQSKINSDSSILVEPREVSDRKQKIQESFVVQNYQPNPSKRVMASNKTNRINNQSIQIVLLAIIAAVFVSLGSNMRSLLYQ